MELNYHHCFSGKNVLVFNLGKTLTNICIWKGSSITLTTKRKLLATGWLWVVIGYTDDEKGSWANKIIVTLIRVH